MNELETKQAIVASLAGFAGKPITDAATALFESLGYQSQKRIALKPNSVSTFVATFAKDKPLNPDHALLADWQSVDFLFQLTDDEVRAAAQGNQQFLFESKGKWNGAEMNSYLFLAITLAKPHYSRTELSGITRAVNRLFPMPAMLLFRHGDTLTLAVNNRRLHKRDESKDVLEKVTLIKDIRFTDPHRAHVEILFDLSFDTLREKHDFANFVALHAAWQKSLDSSELNKRFFVEIANWYFWALHHIEFPKDAPKQDGRDHISVIRLITRLMFVWFIKEKGLVPDLLFDERKLPQILNGFAPTKTTDKESVFYRGILQNLFFATLNTEMDKRGWTKEEQNFMAHSLYRFRESFQKPDAALDLFKNIPFLNGGLFECLDKDLGENAKPRYQRIDGFSRREDSQPVVPDFLFFGPERDMDLSADYGDNKFKKVKVRGLIHTLNHYKFTVAENTPIEEEIALDPELSGKVFENLLAAYNPETGATARKQTGSFYTPREIVNYMVDEALIRGAVVTFQLTPEGEKKLTASGIACGQQFPRALLLDLYRTGDAYTGGSGLTNVALDTAGQLEMDFANDPDPESAFPACDICSSVTDLHLTVSGRKEDLIAQLRCATCRALPGPALDTNIPIALISRPILSRLVELKSVAAKSPGVKKFEDLLRSEFESKWEALRKRQGIAQKSLFNTKPPGELGLD